MSISNNSDCEWVQMPAHLSMDGDVMDPLNPIVSKESKEVIVEHPNIPFSQRQLLVCALFRMHDSNPRDVGGLVQKYLGKSCCSLSFHCEPSTCQHKWRRILFNNMISSRIFSSCTSFQNATKPHTERKLLFSMKITNLDCNYSKTFSSTQTTFFALQLGLMGIKKDVHNKDKLLKTFVDDEVKLSPQQDGAIDNFFTHKQLGLPGTRARSVRAQYLHLYFGPSASELETEGLDTCPEWEQIASQDHLIENNADWNQFVTVGKDDNLCQQQIIRISRPVTQLQFGTDAANTETTGAGDAEDSDASEEILDAKQDQILEPYDEKYLLSTGDTIDMYLERCQKKVCKNRDDDGDHKQCTWVHGLKECVNTWLWGGQRFGTHSVEETFSLVVYKNGNVPLIGTYAGFQLQLEEFDKFEYYPVVASQMCDCRDRQGFMLEMCNE